MSDDDRLDLAARLFAAIEAGDVDGVAALYAPDVVVWHNDDGRSQSGAENLRVLAWLVTHCSDVRYVDVRRSATATGFVQQHVLRATGPSGEAVEVPACIVGTCAEGRITRIDEYLDSAHLAPFTASPPTT